MYSELAKQAYITSRQTRDLIIRPEVVQMMDSPVTYITTMVFAIIMAVIWIILIIKLRKTENQ